MRIFPHLKGARMTELAKLDEGRYLEWKAKEEALWKSKCAPMSYLKAQKTNNEGTATKAKNQVKAMKAKKQGKAMKAEINKGKAMKSKKQGKKKAENQGNAMKADDQCQEQHEETGQATDVLAA